MITSCKINKIANGCGNYSCQYVENGKIKVCSFKTYEDGVSTAFMIWGLTKETHLIKSIILEKELENGN